MSQMSSKTLILLSERSYVTLPPFYSEWFKLCYPHIKLPAGATFKDLVLQICRAQQDTKPAGHQWNTLMNDVFKSNGFTRCLVEHTLYSKAVGTDLIIAGCSTDDFIALYTSRAPFMALIDSLQKYFPVRPIEGPKLKYINIWIVQSAHGISIDQKEHIRSSILESGSQIRLIASKGKKTLSPLTPTLSVTSRRHYQPLLTSSLSLIRNIAANSIHTWAPSISSRNLPD